MEEFNLEMLSTEVASLDEERLMKAFEAGAEIGIPVINIGPGGKSDDEDSLKATLDTISKMSEKASDFRVILCVKAHVGAQSIILRQHLRQWIILKVQVSVLIWIIYIPFGEFPEVCQRL